MKKSTVKALVTASPLLLAACASTPHTALPAQGVSVPPEIRAVLDAPDRSADDKKLDPQRRPAEMLAFFGIRAGQRVADLFAGERRGQSNRFVLRFVRP